MKATRLGGIVNDMEFIRFDKSTGSRERERDGHRRRLDADHTATYYHTTTIRVVETARATAEVV